jgi:ketosteroid isomerase-like protein
MRLFLSVILVLFGGVLFPWMAFSPQELFQVPILEDEPEIRNAIADWSNAVEGKDTEKLLAFYDKDARVVLLAPPVTTGKDGIRRLWNNLMSNPQYSFTPGPIPVELFGSDELAYTIGTWELTLEDVHHKLTTKRGMHVTIWKRQPSGDRKVSVDLFTNFSASLQACRLLPVSGGGDSAVI